MDFDGNITAIGGQGTFQTGNGGTVTFNTAVTLADDVTINTTGGTTDGNVSFAGTLEGANDLTILADMGTVTFTGLVGNGTRLDTLNIASAGAVTASGIRTTNLWWMPTPPR